MSSTKLLKRWISRAFLRPSHHYIACHKEEVVLGMPWGKVQLWREYSHRNEPGRAQVCFLRFLGSRGRAEMATLDPADRLEGRSAEVWTLNPPAFGGTSGPPDLECYADCVLAAVDYLCSQLSVPIWVCGKSIGTSAALLAAAHGGAAGVVLRNVMPLRELLARHYGWRTAGLSGLVLAPAVPRRLDCMANARKATIPALFVVSRDDRVSPRSYQREVIDAYGGPVTMLEVAGGHDDRHLAGDDEAAYKKVLRSLISR
jgi:uncharacterized protein